VMETPSLPIRHFSLQSARVREAHQIPEQTDRAQPDASGLEEDRAPS